MPPKKQNKTQNLLLEIGTEELPAGYIGKVVRDVFKSTIINDFLKGRLREKGKPFELGDVLVYATPRRIVVFVKEILNHEWPIQGGVYGPAKDKARDSEGHWTQAALGFANSVGVSPDKLTFKEKNEREHLYFEKYDLGQPAKKILAVLMKHWILGLKFPKSMRWDPDNTIRFARPIRSIVALLGKDVIDFSVGQVKSGRVTHGHRFLGGKNAKVQIGNADVHAYAQKMKKAGVMIDFDERKEMIVKELKKHGEESFDERLADEVANLVEIPKVLTGTFDKSFLKLPACILESAMKSHQRYFPLHDKNGVLLPDFIFVANGVNQGAERGIVKGNEKVLTARLSDAHFFFNEDTKTTLAEKREKLKSVIFLKETGTTYFEKQEKIKKTCEILSGNLRLPPKEQNNLIRAAELCKADLVAHMVGEFPDLQGRMGKEYALFDKEEPAVAQAIAEHYLPRFAGDILPASKMGAVLAFADKLDTIVSCFQGGIEVTGSRDPYALRRQGTGMIKIARQFNFDFSMDKVLGELNLKNSEKYAKIKQFLFDRIESVLADDNIRFDVARAVLRAEYWDDMNIVTILKMAADVGKFSKRADFESITTTFKRVTNIVAEAGWRGSDKRHPHSAVDEARFQDEGERKLWQAYKGVKDRFQQAFEKKDYYRAMEELISLRPIVDTFFNDVLVMAPDPALKENRLLLLWNLSNMFVRIIDFRQIQALDHHK